MIGPHLIISKSIIALVKRISTPWMELNRAVLSKRCRAVISKEMRYNYERVIHMVYVIQLGDSETVLNMRHKTSYRFHVYEAVIIGEIQSAISGNRSD